MLEKLDKPLHVTTSLKKIVVVDTAFKNCIIRIEEKELVADLVYLDMDDFDTILGMNWLSKYHAYIEYFGKRIVFQIPGKLDSFIKAMHLL